MNKKHWLSGYGLFVPRSSDASKGAASKSSGKDKSLIFEDARLWCDLYALAIFVAHPAIITIGVVRNMSLVVFCSLVICFWLLPMVGYSCARGMLRLRGRS